MAEDDKPSVFGYVDQDAVIKRIDDVQDDDLASCFFGDSISDVESAATEIFDIGMRTTEGVDAPAASRPFASTPPAASAPPAAVPAPPPPAAAAAGLQQDEQARQAFILGGPAAVKKD